MANFRFISRYSISNLDFVVIDSSGVAINADAAPVASFKTYASGTSVWSRATTLIQSPGVYRLTVSSTESANPGLFYVQWDYTIATVAQQYRTDIEIPSSSSPLYSTLSDGYQAVVDYAWQRFEDLFDSSVGGPHLLMYAQSNFGRERVAQLMRTALNNLNSAAQPHSTFSVEDGGQEFPHAEWGGILEQGTTVEIIKHLMRSYVEQPEAVGVTPARLDRRDYLSRWREILDVETEEYKRQLAVFKMAQMNLGRGSILVSGGIYGRIPASSNPAQRPRNLPTWVR